MITIRKTVHIEVAHRFAGHPIEENSRVHGHSLKVTVTAARDEPLIAGMVMDFTAFDVQVGQIVGLLDHRYLNDVKDLGPPTLESVAEYLGCRMAVVGPLRTVSVEVERPSLGQAAKWTP
jgi:6-pyruvoyltetrahydropterin/6-carboxytetrahydropterin synthase